MPSGTRRDRIGIQGNVMSTVPRNLSIAAPKKALPTKKISARVALVDIGEPGQQVLAECFRQFGVEAVHMKENIPQRFQLEKFEACVVRLLPEFEPVMESARCSPSNNRMVIYGLGGNAQEAMKYSKYGINAVFHDPIERPSALKLVRATQMLLLHEFRRYVRIPMITEVGITLGTGQRFTASSREISSGGLSISSNEVVASGAQAEVSFALLTFPRVWIRGNVSWRGSKSFGIRFDTTDDRRLRIKQWIESYLES